MKLITRRDERTSQLLDQVLCAIPVTSKEMF